MIIDSIVRLLPGVLNDINSSKFERISISLKEKWGDMAFDYACLELEKDLQELEDDEKEIFLKEYKIKEPISKILLKMKSEYRYIT